MPRPPFTEPEMDPEGKWTYPNDLQVLGLLLAAILDAASFKIDGTEVTASADELNILDGVTATKDELNILAGTTATAGDLNHILRGSVTGKRLAFGVQATAAAQEDVPTGLTTVEAAFVSMVGAPSMTHFWTRATVGNQTGAPAAGSIRINNTKPTASGNITPIDATSPFGYVAWIALGE